MTTDNVYKMMQEGKPYKSYRKTILGKLYLNTIDSFSGEKEGVILVGDFAKDKENTVIDVYDEKEDMFLHKANRRHFESGQLIPYTRPEIPTVSEDEKINSLSDDEIINLLSSKFLKLQAVVNKFTTVAPVYRMLELAKSNEHTSEKYISFLEGKVSELQLKELGQ